MTSINYDSELKRAGAHSTHGWRKLTFLARRHMLGAIGLVIMVLFVLARVSRLSFERTTIAILPWLLPLLFSLALITYVPSIALWLPRKFF